MIAIAKSWTKGFRRGRPTYPTNGLMPSYHVCRLEGLTGVRRIYERYEPSHELKHGPRGTFCPCVQVAGVWHDLTDEQMTQISWVKKGIGGVAVDRKTGRVHLEESGR